MSERLDFERAWLRKLSAGLDAVAGRETRDRVLQGSESLSSESPREEVIEWTRDAMGRLDSLVEEADRRAILTGCACQHPKTALQGPRRAFEETGDVAVAHQVLQEQFESFLRETLEIDDEGVADIVDKGWGSAGVRKGGTIIATKIPKSGYLLDYLAETDPAKKRELYCHCPRVREALRFSTRLSPTYCYCGAGFYKGIWEEILQRPVEVRLLESVLRGDEVCKFSVHLPLDD